MRILVTGGAGFIGRHLCRRLLDGGHSVVCLDNFLTGSRDGIEAIRVKYPARLTVVEGDVVSVIPAVGHVDQIYNLACPASPPQYQLKPADTALTSALGARNVLEYARRYGAVVLQASTSEVYGDPTVHPQAEGYWGNVNPIGERSCYDEGKRFAETLLLSYWEQYSVEVRIVRIFNTYGPGMQPDDGRVVSNFIMQALRDEDLTIYGSGSQTRSFQYVDDCVDGLVRMMNNDSGYTGPVNIGNPGEFTILELAEEVLKMIPRSKSKIISLPLPADDPQQRQPDISQARRLLDWSPAVRLAVGLRPTIDYFSQFVSMPTERSARAS